MTHRTALFLGTTAILSPVLLALALSPAALAQQQPQFEVASVKLSSPDAPRKGPALATTKETLTANSLSLHTALMWAWQIQSAQISGPEWLREVRLDIVAKAPTPVDDQHLYLMLRSLLADRLGVRSHIERKDMPIYRLTLAKGGPKFSPSATDGPMTAAQGPGGVRIQHVSMFELATELGAKMFDRPLIDSTGLKGRYDLSVDLSPVAAAGSDRIEAVSAMITAMHDQLGLNVETGKDALDVLVIDAANKKPSEN